MKTQHPTQTTISRRSLLQGFFTPRKPAHHATPLFRQLSRTPQINAAYWSLTIAGNVQYPVSFSFDDLRQYPRHQLACTVMCAAHTPHDTRIGHAQWEGVRLAQLLETVTINDNVRYATLEAADGHRTSITLSDLYNGIIATSIDDAPLSPEQGYPARVIIPGLYDHKQPRWIERIALTDTPISDTWEKRGYHSKIAVTSAITTPRTRDAFTPNQPITLEGYAFAGLRQIESVEISVDDGDWMPIALDEPAQNAANGAWTRWHTTWQAPAARDYRVAVRAATADERQSAENVHTIIVRITPKGTR